MLITDYLPRITQIERIFFSILRNLGIKEFYADDNQLELIALFLKE